MIPSPGLLPRNIIIAFHVAKRYEVKYQSYGQARAFAESLALNEGFIMGMDHPDLV
ncbi:MAG: hypothetical protein ACRC62_28020 [Microcoleus sp.]